MFEEFKYHNLFWDGIERFEEADPHLSILKNLKYVHPLDWWKKIDWHEPGIFILTGGRQIGKSTSTKLLILNKLQQRRFDADNIFYLPCDQIDDYHHMVRLIRVFLEKNADKKFLLILDEVTFVKEWDRGIKALADEGHFRRGFCLLTGSDSILLKEAASRFPGRRGNAPRSDFHLYPLSFGEYLDLVSKDPAKDAENSINMLFSEFGDFLKCGGFLRAINELKTSGAIKEASYTTFEQWIRGDFEKRGKRADYLEQVLSAFFATMCSQMSFSALTSRTSDMAKDTFIEYASLLGRMDVLGMSEAFDQNSKRGFPKKAKKFYFEDPFISDVIEKWLMRERRISKEMDDGIKVESIVACNIKRIYPAYYIKAEGEVDIVLVKDKMFLPIEVKWSSQPKERDLKQIGKYGNGVVLTRSLAEGHLNNIKAIPVPLYLASIGANTDALLKRSAGG